MAINPQAMSDYVNQQNGNPPPSPDDVPDETVEPVDDGSKYEALLPLLMEHAEEIGECCDELDYDALSDPQMDMSDEDQMILAEGYEGLDDALRGEMDKAMADGISMDEASSLADALMQDELVDDPDQFAGWLFRVGELIAAKADDMGDDDDAADDDDDYVDVSVGDDEDDDDF